MTATEPDNDYMTVAEPHTVTATVVDDDLPRISIEAPRETVSEGDFFYFHVVREGQTTRPLRVNLNVSQTGAAILESWTGERSQTIYRGHDHNKIGVLSLTGDGDEDDQSVTFEVLEGEGYVIDPDNSTATVTVRDTDPRPTLQVSGTDDTRSVSEGGGAMEFRVFYEGPPSQKEVTVDYSTQSGPPPPAPPPPGWTTPPPSAPSPSRTAKPKASSRCPYPRTRWPSITRPSP